MCLLCDDERAYQAYMNYLDAVERQGEAAGAQSAVNVLLDRFKAKVKAPASKDDPKNDKTLSPFFCSPINR
ncbi:MAG: hypothetical protein JO283_02800 [Bradyrhizobium sp.]|nr:hypothetical protein [Bradyrhizobium sp.]